MFALISLGQKSPLDYPKQRTTDSIFLQPIIYTEIEDIISCLQNDKSTGPFSIPVKVLKLLNPYISKELAHIFNHSICLGIFPDRAKVIPIHKKGPSTDLSNYRPISLLSVFGKILVKLIYRKRYAYLEKLNFFYSLQFGFREKHSTGHALISMTEEIRNTVDKGVEPSLISKRHLIQ